MTVAASAMAERKTFGPLSYRVATRRQSLSMPNMISITARQVHCKAMSREGRLRRLYRRLSLAVRLREERGKLGHLLVGQPVQVAHVALRFPSRESRSTLKIHAS